MAKSNNQLRIIGGQWKRRQLAFASIDGLRPTPDRVRETLFNWLMWDIANARVLDLCAGSGALGFEALSRGAAHVTFVEPNAEQARYLRDNLILLNGQQQSEVLQTTAQQACAQLQSTYDLIFLDPPYALNLWAELATAIRPYLHAQSLIYVEADRAFNVLGLPADWQIYKTTKAGQVQAALFRPVAML
ncbi:16S rRNA (guanine(966)-N(2))-methyltransferase RsmD [Acinetobacter larvae]|uniref:Ribosomal RNA small subunit methyltransferase D n=1 Tax=Acinetobacter larvae TaxID=1789224 RepID=A0A1B2LXY0_9GAMM|nr:16S rRNA (guanine(966)-N(2))-methyltransferase RsmD [Acinetobacter larvae]AOA57800.1 16S rRNA (guanine(966)-N(2))-methyltransferase RsmD [Acinetobacter larvae]